MSKGDERMLDRANSAVVTKQDLTGFVQELSTRQPESRDFESRAVLLAETHPGNWDKGLAIEFRMKAVARLFGTEKPKGWTHAIQPDGATPTHEAVFAAAAVEPLILIDGHVAFDRERFLNRVLELAEEEGTA
jgi:hypothetical protein